MLAQTNTAVAQTVEHALAQIEHFTATIVMAPSGDSPTMSGRRPSARTSSVTVAMLRARRRQRG